MIIKIFWALFLAGFVGIAFYATWNAELDRSLEKNNLPLKIHKKYFFGGNRTDTTVWITPIIFPFLMGAFFLISFIEGFMQGTYRFFDMFLDVVLTMSVYYALLLLCLPLLHRFLSARVCATLWLIPVFLFYQPHLLRDQTSAPFATIYIPEHFLTSFLYIWAIIFLLLFAGQILSHLHFRHSVLKHSTEIFSDQYLSLFLAEQDNTGYEASIRLYHCPILPSPLSMGMFEKKQAVFLPKLDYTPEELSLIFSHELHHLQRRDVHTKFFLSFTCAFCWFNPLVWIMARKASNDLELSCDEIVLKHADESTRQKYATLLLNTAGSSRGYSTCLSAAASSLRYRLKNVVKPHKKFVGVFVLSTLMFLCVLSYGCLAVTCEKGTLQELLLSPAVTSEDTSLSLYYNETYENSLDLADTPPELFDYLSSLSIEKIKSYNEWNSYSSYPLLYFSVKDSKDTFSLDITDNIISVYNYKTNQYEYYLVRSGVDWDYVESFY